MSIQLHGGKAGFWLGSCKTLRYKVVVWIRADEAGKAFKVEKMVEENREMDFVEYKHTDRVIL